MIDTKKAVKEIARSCDEVQSACRALLLECEKKDYTAQLICAHVVFSAKDRLEDVAKSFEYYLAQIEDLV